MARAAHQLTAAEPVMVNAAQAHGRVKTLAGAVTYALPG